MPTIFVPIEVPEEEVARLSLLSRGMITHSNPPSAEYPQGAETPASEQPADPWANSTPTPPVQQGQPQYQQQRSAPPPVGTMPSGQPPNCQHGQMTPIAAGVSQAGRQYGPGWGCPGPRGQQCKPVWSR